MTEDTMTEADARKLGYELVKVRGGWLWYRCGEAAPLPTHRDDGLFATKRDALEAFTDHHDSIIYGGTDHVHS